MLTSKQIAALYSKFGNSFPYNHFALAANAYYLMVTKRVTLSDAVKAITGSSIGFRISDAVSAGQYLFVKSKNRYVPLGYLATVTANVHGGGTLVFSLWFPFYYDNFYPILRDVAHFISSSAGSFSYTLRISPFINHGRFRIQQGNLVREGTFKYQWGDDLCYFEIEIERNCATGRAIRRNSVIVNKCKFIPPLVPSRIPICLVVPQIRFVREDWMISESDIRRTYNALLQMLYSRNYELFRVALVAYQLMVERDYSLYSATTYMARLTGVSSSIIRTFMIRSKLVVAGYPRREPKRKYDPYGYDVMYSFFTKPSPGNEHKRTKETVMELRFSVWQPFYSRIPFGNVMQVAEVLFDSLGNAGAAMHGKIESIVLGIIRAYGGKSLDDIDDVLAFLNPSPARMAIFRNRNKYIVTLIDKNRNGSRYDGIMRYQWFHNIICYLSIEVLRQCAKTYGSRVVITNGAPAILTDTGFAGCDWNFDSHFRTPTSELNFNNVCTKT